MPVPTSSRYEQPLSPPTIMPTPSRSNYMRTPTTTSSYSPTIVSGGGQQKLNVVKKVAIEGKAKRNQDGASIRMFLKLSIPLDSVTPGSTIPLFPEENVKIHTSQVHPLDQNSVPYNFSSTVSPLLHNAARALNLPPRSQESFHSAFNLGRVDGQSFSGRSHKPENGESLAPVDAQYTGHILVSGYAISFVLPKVFLSRPRDGGQSASDDGVPRTPAPRRRSISEREQAHFMAAIDMWVPYLCKPLRYPFLLSIPTPRCLSNNIKLRIFPPENTSSSFASLSSVEEENGTWDLTSDPRVTRIVSTRPTRANSYSHFADDESSDSSVVNTSEGCVIQGTFPSAERIRIRWSKPIKVLNIPGDSSSGRRKVGVEDVTGRMVCTVKGQGRSASNPEVEGVLMHVQYQGECKGIWFPGVATLVGMDVSLRAKGSEVAWPQGYSNHWEVSGSDGYTGFNHGSVKGTSPAISRAPSLDFEGQGSNPSASQAESTNTYLTSKTHQGSSTSSLLRAPLPSQSTADYSFEASNANLGASETLSSVSSLPSTSTNAAPSASPTSAITLHIDINDINPPVKGTFTFNISGTILVTSKSQTARLNGSSSSAGSDKNGDLDPIILPCFTVLAADSESTTIEIRHDVEGAIVEVFHPTGDIGHDPQARKTVLHKGGFTRCGEDGARILVKFIESRTASSSNAITRPSSRPRTPSNNMINRASATSSPAPRTPIITRNRRDGPPIIPWVKADVTAFAPSADMFPTGYAVRLTLQTPSIGDSEWLEFGVGTVPKATPGSDVDENAPPKVHVICASIDGIPVKAEITTATKEILGATAGAAPFEELAVKKWRYWGKVYAGPSGGRPMVIDYIVKEQDASSGNRKLKWRLSSALDLLLPTFFVSVGRLEVCLDPIPGIEITSLRSTFDYHNAKPEGHRLLQYSMEENSQPQLSLVLHRSSTRHSLSVPGLRWYIALTWAILLVAFFSVYRVLLDIRQTHSLSYRHFGSVDSWTEIPTVTATTTVFASSSTRQWFGDPYSESSSSSTTSRTRLLPTPSPLSLKATETIVTATRQPSQTFSKDTTLSNLPIPSGSESYGLIPIDNFFVFKWPDEHLDALKRALEKVVETMEAVWNIFRKVYHYPLDPP